MSRLMHIVGRNLAIRCGILPNTLWLTQVQIPLNFPIRMGVVLVFGWVRTPLLVAAPHVHEGDAKLVLSKEFWSCWMLWAVHQAPMC